jgi:hypothetical protein
MIDETENTENIRRARVVELNSGLDPEAAQRRSELEAQYGQVWSTEEMREEFEVTGFLAPWVGVKRKADGQKGSLEFTHMPRFYFNWQAD